MSTLFHDLRFALRQLRRSPGFTAAAILTLALGIGATTALFSVVNGVLLRALPYEDPSRLVELQETNRVGGEVGGPSPPNFMAIREETRVFSDLALYGSIRLTVTGLDEPRDLPGVEVSEGFFEVFRVEPVLGRGFHPGENHPGDDAVVVLGHGPWQELFGGDPGVLGQAVMIGGSPRTVVGVMPPGFNFPGGREIWVPIRYTERFAADHADNRRSRWHRAVGRLAPGVTPAEAMADLQRIADRLETAFPRENHDARFAAAPLLDQVVGGVRTPLLVLFGAVGLVLLIACGNVAGLLLARGAARRGELAIRAALGASRRRLVRQLLSESVVLAVLGGLAGLLLAWWAVEAVVAARPEGLPRLDDIRVDGTAMLFTFGITLLTGVLAGVIPAVRATRRTLAGTLRESGGGRASGGGLHARAGLVVGQFAMAVVLLAGAGLLLRSLLAILAVDTGLQVERVLTFGVHPPTASYEGEDAVRDYYARLSEHIATLPGVEASSAASWLPIRDGHRNWRVEIEGLPLGPGEERNLHTRFVTPDYFRAMGIPLHRGRHFTAEDRGEIPVIVINQAAAARYFPSEDPLGKEIRSVTDERVGGVVVGVVGDAPQGAVHEPLLPEMYVPHAQAPRRLMTMIVRVEGDPLAAAGTIRRGVHGLDPGVPLRDFRTMDQIVADSLSQPRFLSMLLALFAAVALVMAATGIFGLLSFSVAQRTREIGIRMALGARPGEVIGAVVRRGLVLTATGLGIGIVGALLVTRFLHGILYGVAPNDLITFATVPLLLAAVALLAAYLPARRASRVDPMVALRAE